MKKAIVTGLAALGLLVGTAAFAQQGPQPGAGMAKAKWHVRHRGDRLARLKAELKITSAQEPAWNEFVKAAQEMRPTWPREKAMRTGGELTPAPEVFDKMADRAARRAEKARALARAVKKLYHALTPVQRAIVDTHLADMHRRLGHRWHRGMWHGMRGFHSHPMIPMPPPVPGTGDNG